MDAYYHGCWHGMGHYLYTPAGHKVHSLRELPPAFPCRPACLDAGFLPPSLSQVEGRAALVHLSGWTILAFWDRSRDTRGNSNSAFVFDELLPFDRAVAEAQATFPTIWTRLKFDVALSVTGS